MKSCMKPHLVGRSSRWNRVGAVVNKFGTSGIAVVSDT